MKKTSINILVLSALVMQSVNVFAPVSVYAQTPQVFPIGSATLPSENVFSDNFSLTVCDGPTPPASGIVLPSQISFFTEFGHNPPYIPCDFKALMVQVQHVINIFIILGVLSAIAGFSYAGALYVKDSSGAKDHAKKIFQATGLGFIMMLTAWAIVYQVLSWLVTNQGVKALLPS